MTKFAKLPRKPVLLREEQDYEEIQDRLDQTDLAEDRHLKQETAGTHGSAKNAKTLRRDKATLMKDISIARKALKKGKVLPPVRGR